MVHPFRRKVCPTAVIVSLSISRRIETAKVLVVEILDRAWSLLEQIGEQKYIYQSTL